LKGGTGCAPHFKLTTIVVVTQKNNCIRVDAFRKGPKNQLYNIHYLNVHEKGGHFGYFENTKAVIHDIRATSHFF